MIGKLPISLNVNGNEYNIRSDYRIALLCLQAFADEELTDLERQIITLSCLYENYEDIPDEDINEALKKAIWFLDCGKEVDENAPKVAPQKRLYDWEQDEQIIFSAINKVAGKEVRAVDYIHFWTFIGYFNEIGEGVFSSVVSIRNKKNKGKKLDKDEQEFYRKNKDIIDLKKKRTDADYNDLQALNEILNQ